MALKLGSNDTAILAGSSVVKQMLLGSSPKFAAPVLDHVPGAAAAYSLRRLSNAYSGPVVKVRRSSDSTTADFTAAEVVDGTLEAWVGAGDGFVDTWYDQSGNERNATQATAGYQPKLVNSGTLVTEGGKAAISFADSANACLKAAFAVSQPDTVLGVLKFTSLTGSYLYDGYSADGRQASYVTSGVAYLYAGTASSTGHVVDATSQSLYFAVFDGASSSLSLNGVTQTCDAGTDAADGVTIGARYSQSQGGDGTFSELIIYPSDVSASRELAEGEMAWHYGLQAKLPYNHAYAPQALGGSSQTVPTDSDVLAFAAASGAKSIPDLNKIEDLVTYLKAQGLWDYARFFPMKSAQNAGTGSTVYGLGGLTSNNMTLVNSPTWGSDGVTFDAASTQYATAGDFLGGGTLNLVWRGSNTTGSASDAPCAAQYDYGASRRSHALAKSTSGLLQVARSADGVTAEVYRGSDFPDSDKTVSIEWIAGSGRSAIVDGVQDSLILAAGSDQTQRLNAADDITVMSYLNNGSPAYLSSGTVVLSGWIETALTTTQRETITDLINAL